ncbi:LPXTG-motif cell wall anchor domain protein [Streptococcus mitis]|uniref:LPXTG-motif cell wall anchor domain protein n=1 Tax=Streptococcus mitis TaxID=28037 RepID=A0A081QBB2_STRMT|nr:GEVED domain-containing protein [Streptococcus mitis]KEQ40235.1 LPXTG-motif cell wall anchor domain protein [Streptococcus mitis]
MFKLSRQEKDHRYFCGNKYEKYSIKKLKIGAASVLVGTGFLFGYNLDQVSANEQSTETTTIVTSKDGDGAQSTDKLNLTTEPKQENTPERVTETPKSESKVDVVSETSSQAIETKEVLENKSNKVDKETVNSSMLRANLADLEAQIERIRGNKKQASQIQNAEKLVAEARQYLEALDTTQKEVDTKAKQISSLTSILKSIKAEETVKESKNQDSRNGKKMEEGVSFRTDTAAGTGISADVKDATSTPAATRDGYTDRATAESLTKQITWLDFGDVANWQNVDNEGGKIYLKEGSIYKKEVISGYVINIKVKSLKPFQATEIYRKRMEAANASEEEKATFNPNATNQFFGVKSGPARITANKQDDTWSEIRNNGINTENKKTAIGSESDWSNVGVQFEISATYKGKNVRPAVIMNDSESANHGENIILTTNGSPWERVLELKKERFVGGTFTPTPYKPINNYNLRHEDYPQSGSQNNASDLLWHSREGLLTFADGRKLAPKYFTNPDQETGGLGTGVFGPVTSSGGYSLPVLMTKDATEVGLYILSSGIQTAMMGVIPIDEGDAPESYGKASHTINTVNGVTGGEVKQPYLGSTRPDMDTGTTKDWYGDDNDIDADEGVNQLLPENLKGSEGNIIKANISKSGNYTLNVQAHTGGAEKAYIRSWIDFNKNGQFDADEASEIATITTDGTVKLNFKNKRSADVETLLEAGARVRIATEESEIENPTGTAFSGEVEDFIAKITHPPKGEKKTTVGNIKETQREEIHFTAQGKNVYLEDHPNAEIDTTVQPTYIDNKTGQEVTLSSDGTYTVEGEGTYKFAISDNGKDVKVEFTPADGFVGKANGITIRRQDTNKTTTDWGTPDATTLPNVNDSLNTMDGLYIPEVTVPTSVNATPVNAESQNLQGLPQKGKPTFNVESAKEPVTASAKYPAKLVDPRTNVVTELTTVDAFEQGTTNKIGTYTIVPETGEVTFTPNKDFKGIPSPATISADVELTHDKDGNITKKTLTANYTPTIIPVVPTAEASTTSDIIGKKQVSPIKLDTEETGDDKGKTVNFNKGAQTGPNGERVELNPDTLTLLDGENEVTSVTTTDGKYELDKANKTITFTPNATFTGVAKPVSVRIKDANGTKVDTTYTPTVTDVTMEGTPKETEAPQGQTQTGTPEFTVSNPDVRITGYKLINPTTNTPVEDEEIEVPNQGTYRIDKTTGTVKFIPKAGFTGPADGINVQAVTDVGKTHEAKYTPTVNPFVIIAVSQESKNIQGVPQEGTPTFTIPEDVTSASITSRKLVDPSDNTPKDSVTVEGKGTFVIDETGKVTFTPVPSYTGEVPAIEVKATATVTNEKNETATVTQTATYQPEIVPLELGKTPATSTNLQGLEQKGTPTFTGSTVEVNGEQKEVTITPNSYTLVKDGAEVTTTPAYKKGTTEEIGTYTINPATGEVTLTPTDKTYTGEVEPAVVQATGSNNVKVQTTYTPTITPVTPTAEKSETSDVQGKVQTSPIKLDTEETGDDKGKTVNFDKGTQTGPKGERVELDPETLTLLNEAGEEVTSVTTPQGKYELDKANKTISFTPNKDFVGTATPVKVQIKDVNGTKVETTYTPTVTDVTMESVDKTSEAPQGQTQTGKPEFTISSPNVQITGYKLVDPVSKTPVDSTEIEVPEQGTYKIDKTTGQVTFIPKPGYTGTADGITVQATDENGETKDAKYTPKVTPLTVTPENKTSKNIQGLPQEGTPTFTIPEGVPNASITSRKLVDPSDNTPKDSVTVEGKGTFVIDETGKVTFTPVPSYTGEVPAIEVEATVTVTNEKNEPATITSKATYTPEIVPVKPTAESSTTSDVQGKVQTSSIVLDTEETGDDKGKTVNFNKGIEQGPKGERTELNPDTLTLLNEAGEEVTSVTTPQGKYELDKANKTITFTPNKDFVGTATPVKVQIKDVNGTKVETTYTPTVIEVTPIGKDSATTGPQGIAQTSPIVFNQKDESDNTTVNFETGHERVELKQDTLTLVNGNGEKVTTITVPAVGTYELKDGAITFTPVKTFTGTAEGVTVQVEDENGKVVTKKYVPTVTPVTPEGTPAETTGIQGATQEGTPTFKPGNPNVPIDETVAPTLEGANPEGKVVVPGEGTYTVDKDGKVTFTPEPQFTGTAKGVTVKRVDKNGTPVTANYTPTVTPVVPTGENSETEGPKAQPQTSTIVFDKKDNDTTTVNFDKGHDSVPLDSTTTTLVGKDGLPTTEVKVSGEGTYTLANNVITFTPESDFAGKSTGVSVQVKDANGTVVTKTYTPTVRPVTTFVDASGNSITVDKNNTPVVPEEDGKQPNKDIYGYKFVRTETDNKGNTKHVYELAKGQSVKVTYETTTGEGLKDPATVQPKDTLVGTDYDASTETIKLERIEKDGKVYLLKERKADSASENGKVSDKEQTITYVYEEVKEPAPKQNYGSVVVVYTDKFGRPISGITETGKEVGNTVLDTSNAPLNTKYDTTDNRPQTITTKDGKVYTLKKVTKNSDAEQSGVKGRTSVVTYVYEILNNTEEFPEAHIGVVLVNYQDEEGNPISGKTPEGKAITNVVVDTDATLVDTEYDTTDNKPSVIIAENGDVYELVKASDTSVEKGKVVEGATIVDYVYRKVETKFVDENGNELKSPEKGRKDKSDISGYEFKETKKDEKGNRVHVYQKVSTPREENESKVNKPSEKVTSSNPSTSTPSIDSVLTTFVDENGNVIIREENGSHPGREIEGYELIGVKRDSRGNVRNVYRKIQSQKPVQPVEPATPAMPEQPAKSEVPATPAQPVQPTEVKEAEGKRELPNTGTEDNARLAALGLLGVLSGFGLVARKKKED